MRRFSFFLAPRAPAQKDVSSAWKVSTQDAVPACDVAADGAVSVASCDDVAVYCYL